MKQLYLFALPVLVAACATGKHALKSIRENDVTRIETTLSADDMQGRMIFTPGIDKAADFIASEMKKIGLQTLNNQPGYFQQFVMKKYVSSTVDATIDGKAVDASKVICVSTSSHVQFDNNKPYYITYLNQQNFRARIRQIVNNDSNMLILADTGLGRNFNVIKRFQMAMFENKVNKVFVLTDAKQPGTYSFNIHQQFEDQPLKNVVGFLPGKSKPNEYVVFSGHYDHLGFGKPNDKNDSLYNGANDDASGVTGMLSLARYYKKLNNNERSLLFVAFTAEESGGFGATYFSRQLNPESVVAMFNIEMIGTESKWGKNSAYITGYEKSDLGTILQKNLQGSKFAFYPDPYTTQQLFYRSDNATLARLGVPAHTISTSKMDSEPHYHKPSDEVQTLDMNNMTEVIKAIAVSAAGIVKGVDTPSRIPKLD